MWRSRSSVVLRPVISCSAAPASCRSSSGNSSDTSDSSAAAARDQRFSRAFQERGVADVGDLWTIAKRFFTFADARYSAPARTDRGDQTIDAGAGRCRDRHGFDGIKRFERLRRAADRSCSTTTTRGRAAVTPSSSRSSFVNGRDRSSITIVKSATRDCRPARVERLPARRHQPSRRTPAVSIEREREPADVGLLGQQIACRAGNRSDDRAIRVEQDVEQTRLADIRRADDRHGSALPDKAAAPRLRQQRIDARDHASDRPCSLPSARRSDSPRQENPATPRASRRCRTAPSRSRVIVVVNVPSSWSKAALACSGVTASIRSATASAWTRSSF